MSEHSRLAAFQAAAEPLLALVLASTLTLLATLPFLPTELEAALPMRPASGSDVVPPDEVVARVEALGVARSVEIVLKDGSDHLVLRDVTDTEGLDARLLRLLRSAGYLEQEVARQQVFSVENLLDRDPRALPALLSIQTLTFLLLGLILARLRAPGRPAARTTPLRALGVGVAGGIVALLASAAIGSGLEALGLPVEEQAWLARLFADPVAMAWLAPWIVLFGPVAEEVFFRRYAYRAIAERAGLPAGLLVSSAMFATIHFNPSGFVVYLVIGAVLAWVYERTGRLLAPIAGHVTVNAVVLLAALVPGAS